MEPNDPDDVETLGERGLDERISDAVEGICAQVTVGSLLPGAAAGLEESPDVEFVVGENVSLLDTLQTMVKHDFTAVGVVTAAGVRVVSREAVQVAYQQVGESLRDQTRRYTGDFRFLRGVPIVGSTVGALVNTTLARLLTSGTSTKYYCYRCQGTPSHFNKDVEPLEVCKVPLHIPSHNRPGLKKTEC